MREFFNPLNKKVYYIVMVSIIIFMAMGLIVDNPFNVSFGYLSHMTLVIIIAILLLIYPKFETHVLRTMLIIVATIYFYTIFFLYPETFSLFVFLCIIPAFSILFFDERLFYFSLFFNGIGITITFCYVIFMDYNHYFSHIKEDFLGNMISYLSIQVILFFIFHMSCLRIKKQRIYYEQIQQSERLKTTGQLTAAVAHEIRNPLTVVKGFLQYYEQDQSLDQNVKKNFSLMIDELKTAEHVISQFLMIAKPDKDKKMEKVDVHTALQSIVDILQSYGIFHDNTIELNVEENCYIAVNLIEFKQLMINFIKNAIEASTKGDSILVRAMRNGESAVIQILDHGTGMSKEEINSLGVPFYSLKSKGTGLGLMICFTIVEKYKGTLHFTSEKGEGTTVTVGFPLASAK